MANVNPRHKAKATWLPTLLYVVVLLTAGYGQATGIVALLGLPLLFAIPIVAVMELFAVVFAHNAQERRKLGEAAWASWIFAAALAAFAVVINWGGHYRANVLLAGFFAGLSAAGFIAYLIISGGKRRDVLRAEGKLAKQPPIYGPLQWLTQPRLTRRARALAIERGLKLHPSLAAAAAEIEQARRRRAIYALVRQDMDEAFGPQVAELVATVADPDRLAAEIERQVDWERIAAALAARVDPEQFSVAVARADRDRRRRRGRPVVDPTTNPTTPPVVDPTTTPDHPTTGRVGGRPTKATKAKATTRPKRPDQHPTTDPTTAPDHGPTAKRDAATIRSDFPDGLPAERGGQRLLRDTYGWHPEKATKALAAYADGADLELLVGSTNNPTTTRPRGGDQ